MDISGMRECVSNLYQGSWPDRVANMKQNQVRAIFFKNFRSDGSPKEIIKKEGKIKVQNNQHHKNTQENTHQITIWEIL